MKRLTARSPKNNMAYLMKVKLTEQEVESPYPNTLNCILESFNRLAAYEDTGLMPEEIAPLAHLMRKFGHGGKDTTVFVGEAESNRVVINGRMYSMIDLMNAVDANAALREKLDKAREVALSALNCIEGFERCIDLPKSDWRDSLKIRLRELAGEVTV
jgi:hypothetical protein